MESETVKRISSPPASTMLADENNAGYIDPSLGTVVLNRVFVRGLDNRITKNDLWRLFSKYGAIKEVNIIVDRTGLSKGYGFVTFENQEDAERVLHSGEQLYFRDKRLNVGQAICKQNIGWHYSFVVESPSQYLTASTGTTYMTTSTGCPYTYHNGVAYFNMTEPNTHPTHWPTAPTVAGSPVMLMPPASHFYSPQTYHQYQPPSHCASGHMPWATSQAEIPVPSYPVLYVHPSELMYRPMDLPADTAIPLVETAVHEQDQRYQPIRRGFSHPPMHRRARYGRASDYAHRHNNYHPSLVSTSSQSVSSSAQEVQQ